MQCRNRRDAVRQAAARERIGVTAVTGCARPDFRQNSPGYEPWPQTLMASVTSAFGPSACDAALICAALSASIGAWIFRDAASPAAILTSLAARASRNPAAWRPAMT